MTDMAPPSSFKRPAFLDGKAKRLLIGGRWVEAQSGKTFTTVDPCTGDVLDALAEGDAADVDLAVAAARKALKGPWGQMKPAERQTLMLRIAELIEKDYDELSAIDSIDMGQPVAFHVFLKRLILNTIRFFAGQTVAIHGSTLPNSAPGQIFSYTIREPVGVVGAIIPWNGPISAAVMKLAPALAAGCTIVMKPAEQASLGVLRLGEICMEAGLPDGVLNIITGYGRTAGAALAAHMDVDKVSFTGSTRTGQEIIRASAGNIKRVTLELGGKSADIILDDADMDAAVPGAAWAAFANSGQACIAGSRLFVHRKIHDEFTQRLADFARTLKIGHSLDPSTELGPLASPEHFARVTGYFKSGHDEGARAVAGGMALTDGAFAKGCYVAPTVFVDVRDDMTIAREEIFGPVISTLVFDDISEVIDRANATSYGLGSGVWTRDVGKVHQIANAMRAGSVWVNCWLQMDAAVPFGGYKMSGYGQELGAANMDQYLSTKTVWINTL